VLRWQPSKLSSEVPLSADVKAKLVNADERQVRIGKYPLAIKLPILLRLWGIAHLGIVLINLWAVKRVFSYAWSVATEMRGRPCCITSSMISLRVRAEFVAMIYAV
jgi:hypothetical protein